MLSLTNLYCALINVRINENSFHAPRHTQTHPIPVIKITFLHKFLYILLNICHR